MRVQLQVYLLVLLVAIIVIPCQGQTPVQDIRAMSGPWECTDSRGIHGISIFATTTLVERNGSREITSQIIDVRAYERSGSDTFGGFTSINRESSQGATLTGTHLIIHQVPRNPVFPSNFIVLPNGTRVEIPNPPIKTIPAYDLDVQFDSVKQRWAGTWSLCDKTGDPVLERPHQREGVASVQLVGDWIGSPVPRSQSVIGITPEGVLQPLAVLVPRAPELLHIVQASDGTFISWLDENEDRVSDGRGARTISQRDGQEIHFDSTASNGIVFGITYYCSSCFGFSRYEGTLSADGETITGNWYRQGAILGNVEPVSTVFQRTN